MKPGSSAGTQPKKQRFTLVPEQNPAVLEFLTNGMARSQKDTFLRDSQSNYCFMRSHLPWMVGTERSEAWQVF